VVGQNQPLLERDCPRRRRPQQTNQKKKRLVENLIAPHRHPHLNVSICGASPAICCAAAQRATTNFKMWDHSLYAVRGPIAYRPNVVRRHNMDCCFVCHGQQARTKSLAAASAGPGRREAPGRFGDHVRKISNQPTG
jgi:hypothetical protein